MRRSWVRTCRGSPCHLFCCWSRRRAVLFFRPPCPALPCRLTGPATSNGFQSASGSDPASTSVVPSGLIWAGKLDDPGQQHPVRSAVPERRTEGRQGTEPDPHTPPRCGTTPTHRPVERPGSGIKREIKPTCCRIKISGRPKPPRLRIIPLRWDAAARPHRRPAVRRLRQPC